MSKRHTDITTGKPLPEGCIFYAPLTQGDFADHVSGATMVHNANVGTVVWDSTYNMYKFTQTNGQRNCCIGHWNVDFAPYFQGLVTEEWTIAARVVFSPQNGRPYLAGLGNYNENSAFKPNLQPMAIGGPGTYTPVTEPTFCACIRDGVNYNMTWWPKNYIDTSQISTSSTTNPANWNKTTNHILDRVCIHLCRENGYLNMWQYTNSLMVFNKALTFQELEAISNSY